MTVNAYYTSMVIMSCLTLIVMSVLTEQNARLERETKKRFYFSYALIAFAFIFEWASIALNGAPESTRNLHLFVKCFDYVLTPAVGISIVIVLLNDSKISKTIGYILAINGILQVVSMFTGWTFYIDKGNVYRHGPYHIVYLALYFAICLLVVFALFDYGKKHTKQNRISLYAILLFVVISILMQELSSNGVVRTALLGVSIAVCFLYIHYNEFSHALSDEIVLYQKSQLEIDPLTRILNRYSYNNALKDFEDGTKTITGLAVLSLDINGLKAANDKYGHLAGDELIQGASSCIRKAISPFGKCYRTGGDEFMAFGYVTRDDGEKAIAHLKKEVQNWKGSYESKLYLSIGCAFADEHPGIEIAELIAISDKRMYEDKANFYLQTGFDRRQA